MNSGHEVRGEKIGRFRVDFHRWQPRHAEILVFSFTPLRKWSTSINGAIPGASAGMSILRSEFTRDAEYPSNYVSCLAGNEVGSSNRGWILGSAQLEHG